MSLENLEKAFQLIKDNFTIEEINPEGGCSSATIKNAEALLNLKFSVTYRKFLKKYKLDSPNILGIYSLTKEDDFKQQDNSINWSSNSVWRTVRDHQDFGHPLYLLIIYDLGEGSKYCLDLSQMKDNECPVVVWPIFGYENNPKLEIIAKDFGDFLLEMTEEKIKWWKEEENEEA